MSTGLSATAEELLATQIATAANFDAQRYLLANPDLADHFRDGGDPWTHLLTHGLAERRRQLAGRPAAAVETRNAITLCAIARDEGHYLVEWIAYHRLIGIDQIVVYSNDSRDDSDLLLDRLAAQGLLQHRRWPARAGVSSQVSAYADATVRCNTRWILFLDLDEFLNLHDARSAGELVAGFASDVSAVALNWRLFGSANEATRRQELVVARFTRAAPRLHPLNTHIKTLAVAPEIYRVGAHRVRIMHGRYVDAMGDDLDPGRGFAPVRHERVQVNHYILKSREEFAAKRDRGSALLPPDSGQQAGRRGGAYFDDHDRNEEEDVSILRHLPALREAVGMIERMLGGSDHASATRSSSAKPGRRPWRWR